MSIEDQLKPFKHVIAMGGQDIAKTLSLLIKKQVVSSPPELNFLTVEEVPKFIGNHDHVMKVVLVKLSQGITGTVVFLFDPKMSEQLVELINSNKLQTDAVLKEIVNIVLGGGLTSMANYLSIKIIPSPPIFVEDMVAAALDTVIAELGQQSQHVLISKTDYSTDEVFFKTFFLANPKSSEDVYEKVKDLESF